MQDIPPLQNPVEVLHTKLQTPTGTPSLYELAQGKKILNLFGCHLIRAEAGINESAKGYTSQGQQRALQNQYRNLVQTSSPLPEIADVGFQNYSQD